MTEEEFERLVEELKNKGFNEAEAMLTLAREEQEKLNNLPWKKEFDLKLKAQAPSELSND